MVEKVLPTLQRKITKGFRMSHNNTVVVLIRARNNLACKPFLTIFRFYYALKGDGETFYSPAPLLSPRRATPINYYYYLRRGSHSPRLRFKHTLVVGDAIYIHVRRAATI